MDPGLTQHRPRRLPAGGWLRFLACGLAIALAILAPGARAEEEVAPGAPKTPLQPSLPWLIEADRIDHDRLRDETIARGDVVISRQGRSISADVVRYNQQTMMVYAEGHVVVISGTDVLSGSYLEFDLESEKGFLDDGVVFLRENNYHLQGDRIQKVGPDLYAIDRGVVTTCDRLPADWKISGRDIKVHEDGSGSAWNALVYAGDVPLAYFPYISFPARNRHQSGFLFPEMGYSKRKGVSYNQPFFWAIDDRSDATFYEQYMSERGLKTGLEYRYYLNQETKGAVLFDFFRDDKIDDGEGSSSKDWGYNDANGVFLRPNRDRYWFRMAHYNPLPGGVRSYLDLDVVSDQDYLREFRRGYMGYEETELLFQRFLGRQIDDFDDPVRTNRLLFDKSWPEFYLSAGTLLYDDVRKGRNRKDITQRLPVVRGIAPKQQILESPFFNTVNSEYVNFYQDRGYQIQRMDIWPRLYYPYTLSTYINIEPSVGFRQTIWDQYETAESDPWSDDRYFHREIYDTRLALSTDFYRVFNVDGDAVQKIKHSVRPEVAHTYVPEVSQDSLPNITSRDRIENRSRITYALTNTLTSKSLNSPERNEDHPRKENPREVVTNFSDYDYRDFLRLRVGQYYDVARHEKPFSPFSGKLTFFPGGTISLGSEAAYDVYEDRLERYNAGVTVWARRNDRLFVQYRYDRNTEDTELDEYESGGFIEEDKTTDETEVNSLYTSLRLGLTDRLSFVGSYERDFVFDRPASYTVGVIYETQCWTIEPLFFKEEEDVGFGLRVRLKGIGEVGF